MTVTFFLAFINVIRENISLCKIILYADDAKIYTHVISMTVCQNLCIDFLDTYPMHKFDHDYRDVSRHFDLPTVKAIHCVNDVSILYKLLVFIDKHGNLSKLL